MTATVVVLVGLCVVLYFVFRTPKDRTSAGPPIDKPNNNENTADDPKTQKGTQSAQDKVEAEAATAHGPAVALIEGLKGRDDLPVRGSGFLIAPDLLVTSSRVIREHPIGNLRITFPTAAGADKEASGKAVLLYEHPRRDLAVLRIPRVNVAPLRIAAIAPNPVSSIVGVGYPFVRTVGDASRRLTVRAQQVSLVQTGFTDQDRPLSFYRIDGVRTPVSGAPLLNVAGEVVGVVVLEPPTVGTRRRPELARAIPLADLQAAVQKAQERTAEEIKDATAKHDAFHLYANIGETWQFHRQCLNEAVRQAREAEKKGIPLQDCMRELRRERTSTQDEDPDVLVDPNLAHQRHYESLRDEMSKRDFAANRSPMDERLMDFRTNYLKLRLLYLTPPRITASEFELRIQEIDNTLKKQLEAAIKEFGSEY